MASTAPLMRDDSRALARRDRQGNVIPHPRRCAPPTLLSSRIRGAVRRNVGIYWNSVLASAAWGKTPGRHYRVQENADHADDAEVR